MSTLDDCVMAPCLQSRRTASGSPVIVLSWGLLLAFRQFMIMLITRDPGLFSSSLILIGGRWSTAHQLGDAYTYSGDFWRVSLITFEITFNSRYRNRIGGCHTDKILSRTGWFIGITFFHDISMPRLVMVRRRSLLDIAAMGGHIVRCRHLLAVLDSQGQRSWSTVISTASDTI
jgi:hypothetical protein